MTWTSPRVIRGNRGDIASRFFMLKAILARGDIGISSVFASRESHVPSELRRKIVPYGLIYNALPSWAGLKALWRARYVIWTGGLDLQDDSSLVKLVHTWLVFLSYRLMGLRILLAHQGAGPLNSRTGRWLARRVLSCVKLVLARDKGSHTLISSLMPADRVHLAADGIFLGSFPDCSQRHPLLAAGPRPVIGINIRLWFHFTGSWLPYQFASKAYQERAAERMERLIEAFAAIVYHLRSSYDARVILVSMYEPGIEPWEDDISLLQQLKAKFDADAEVVVLQDDLDIEQLCCLFSGLTLMIGTRLHSTLIALRAGVPAVHISYTLKGRSIYGDLGLADWVIEIEDFMLSPGLATKLADELLNYPAASERVRLMVDDLIERNEQNLATAIKYVEAN